MSFGENLKKYRISANLTQAELAQKLGIIQTNIHRWESNKIIPTVETLKKLSTILNISADDLIFSPLEKSKLKKIDKELISKLGKLESLNPEDKKAIIRMIDAFTKKSS